MSSTRRHPEWDSILSACQQNDSNKVREILQSDKNAANHSNQVGQSALHIASWWGHMDCISLLLEKGANIHATNLLTQATPLHCTIQSTRAAGKPRRLQSINLLLSAGADPDALDKMGKKAIDYLNTNDPDVEVIKAKFSSFMALSADKHYYKLPKEEQRVFKAVRNRSLDELKDALSGLSLALASFSEISIQSDQQTPLDLLVEDWCNLETTNEFFSMALSIFVDVSIENKNNCYLEENGPINSCVENLCDAVFQYYRAHKSIKDPQVQDWISAVSKLIHHSTITSFKTNISQPASLWLDITRRNFLDLAIVWWEHWGIAFTNVVGRQGMTPLHFASRSGHLEMVKYLLRNCSKEKGIAMIYATNQIGQTPMQAAKVNQHEAVAEWLQRFENLNC